jgi:hypothetical protein
MKRVNSTPFALIAIAGVFAAVFAAQTYAAKPSNKSSVVPGILPTGLGEAIDRDVERLRTATERFKVAAEALAAGYESTTHCVAHPTEGGMGLHFDNQGLRDAKLELEKPEVLVYGKLADGTLKLNGVEYIVPLSAWNRDEPPSMMGQNLKRADKLGIWYLHVWNWEPSPSSIFADWNPRVKCPPKQ